MDDDHIFLSAGGIAFSTILCLIPIVLLAFSILSSYLTTDEASVAINTYIDALNIFPVEKEKLRTEVFETVREFTGVRGTAGIIGAVGLVWAASALFGSLRSVFNRIFHIHERRNIFLSKVKDFVMLSIIGVVFIITALTTYIVSSVRYLGGEYFGPAFEDSFISGSLTYVASIVVAYVAFHLLFLLVPDKRIPLRAIVLSSGIATVLWELAKHAFGYYISHLWRIGRVYGPYSFLVATAIWIYYSSLTIVIAAEFGQMMLERSYMRSLLKPAAISRISGILKKIGIGSDTKSQDLSEGVTRKHHVG